MRKKKFRFLVDGAFSSPLSDILNTKIAFYIANGIGITPMASILTYLSEFWGDCEYPYRIHLIWVVPYVGYLSWIDDLLIDIHNKNWMCNKPDRFNFELFITKENDFSRLKSAVENEILINRISLERPNWINVLRSWHSIYLSSPYSLYICGSKQLSRNVKKAAAELATQGITFNLIQEAFI